MQLSMLWTWLTAGLHMGEHDERGANLVEYILLIVFIALVVIAAVTVLQGAISNKFNDASNTLDPPSS